MKHFLIAALIVLALSSLASSKEKYLMETPDCNSCIWQWNNKVYFRFNKLAGAVCFWRHLNAPPPHPCSSLPELARDFCFLLFDICK